MVVASGRLVSIYKTLRLIRPQVNDPKSVQVQRCAGPRDKSIAAHV